MIIGYSVLYINDDTDMKDVLWAKRIVYNSWEKALEMATNKAEEVKNDYKDEITYISIFRADSKKTCDKNGNTIVYKFIYKQYADEFGNIYIVPVYDE
jgi:hypothetical protein